MLVKIGNRKEYKRYKRMCIACKKMFLKTELLRFVKNASGEVFFDGNGKINGRGSYICMAENCCRDVVKKRLLNKYLKGKAADEIYEMLQRRVYGC